MNRFDKHNNQIYRLRYYWIFYRLDSIQGKKMTNFEKYKDEITQLTNEHKRIAFVNGKVVSCSDIDDCTICKFGNPKDSCHFLIVKWLCEEYEELKEAVMPKQILNKRQRWLLEYLGSGYLKRNYAHVLRWFGEDGKSCEVPDLFDVFPFIEECDVLKDKGYSVEEMLTWEVENDKF